MTPNVASALTLPVSPRDHMLGPITAPATLVEYGDYQCPFCKQAHVVTEALVERCGDLLCFVFRHFPLTSMHPHAKHAAEAAEAAGAQGKFWEMHDCLFANQHALDDVHLMAYASAIGLNMARFNREMIEHRYEARVREVFMSGARSGVNGTPSFFINGLRYDGPRDFATMLAVVTAAAQA